MSVPTCVATLAALAGALHIPSQDGRHEDEHSIQKLHKGVDESTLQQLKQNIDRQYDQADKALKIGILGGSISFGDSVQIGKSYPELLSAKGLTVYNRAIPATGVALPSFCVDELLPEQTDFLVIEYAVNDGHFGTWHTETIVSTRSEGGQRTEIELDPLGSMERLIRHVRRTRPNTVPLILYICPSKERLHPCDGLYSPVARHYGVQELSIAALLGPRIDTSVMWNMHHPDPVGHAAAALLVMRTLNERRQMASPNLPPPAYLPAWDSPHADWLCHTCDWAGCDKLQPTHRAGFELRGFESQAIAPSRGASNEQMRKAGWAASQRASSVAFGVPPSSRVLAALLCSYENVGSAELAFSSGGAQSAPAAPSAWRTVDLVWTKQTSQQCIVDAGISPADAGLLWVQSGPNARGAVGQVKVFGVYTQQQRPAAKGMPSPSGDFISHQLNAMFGDKGQAGIQGTSDFSMVNRAKGAGEDLAPKQMALDNLGPSERAKTERQAQKMAHVAQMQAGHRDPQLTVPH